MDRASSLIFPGSRTLVGWWRQLLPYQPQAFWIGYGFLHRIEAPVKTLCKRPVEPLTHLVQQAIALELAAGTNHGPGVGEASLQSRLRLPSAVVQRVLAGMEELGFLAHVGLDRWQPTERGQRALHDGFHPVEMQERRNFPFLENLDATGQRSGPAHHVPIAECVHVAWQVDDAHRFEPRWLQDCIAQSDEAKKATAFPADVLSLIADTPAEEGQHVILDRPERVLLVLIRAGAELLGFAVKVDGWTLSERTPILRLPAACADWPEIAHTPAASVWQEAWRSWCRQRQLPTNEVDTCTPNYHAPRLEIQAPSRLVQRLQAAKSDLFKGEAWLLVGDGYMRSAAQLAIRA